MLMSKNVNNDVSKDSPIQCEPGFRKTMDSSEDEGLFVTQSSTLILYRLLKAAFLSSFK